MKFPAHRVGRVVAAAAIAWSAATATAADAPSLVPAVPCSHELVYTPFGGLILVQVTIAGSPPLDFVLDSGATQSALTDPYLAEALGLEVREAGLARGMGSGATRVLIADDTSIRADGSELVRVALVVHDIGVRLSQQAGREIHGFLGAELFERYLVEIDPATRRILFHDPELAPDPRGGLVLPMAVEDRRPVIEGQVTARADGRTIPVRLMVDTGSSRNLTLIAGSKRRLKPPEETVPSASYGIIGETTVTMAPVAKLQLGSLVSHQLETSWVGSYQVPAVRNIPDLNGILGNGVLGRVRSVFDYGRGRLVLWPLP